MSVMDEKRTEADREIALAVAYLRKSHRDDGGSCSYDCTDRCSAAADLEDGDHREPENRS